MPLVTAISMQQTPDRIHGMMPRAVQTIAGHTASTLEKTSSMTHPGRR